jgi:hypothetical protein
VNQLRMKQINNAGDRVNQVTYRIGALRSSRPLTKAVVGAIAACAAFAAGASAKCGPTTHSNLGVASTTVQSILARAHGQLAPEPDLIALPQGEPTIAGMWLTSFVVDGQLVDVGFDQWTSDGTELLNDITPVLAGNVCLGTWLKIGPFTYKLNHPSWIYDDAGVNPIGIVYIREHVTLDKGGKTFSGTVTFDEFDLAGNRLAPQNTAEVAATRITVDTVVGPLMIGENQTSKGGSVVASRRRASDERVLE